jgi:hypothetical protein
MSNSEPTKPQSGQAGGKSSTDRWIAVFTGILTLFSALQYWAMRQQARYMRDGLAESNRAAAAAEISANNSTKALEHTQESLRKTERAVVVLELVEICHWRQPGKLDDRAGVFFTLKNFGRTVAYQVVTTGRLEFENEFTETMSTHQTVDEFPQIGAVTLASGGDHLWNSRNLGNWLPRESLWAINSGHARLRYAITVTYRDVFGDQHVFEGTGKWDDRLSRFDSVTDTTT